MAYGDVNYKIVKTASVVYATTALGQALLLTDNSLSSTFSADDVMNIDVQLLNANTFYIAPSHIPGNTGLTIRSGSLNSLKPMTVDNIKNLNAYLSAASSNASAAYTFWQRLP